MNAPKIEDREKNTNISMAVYSAYLDAARPSIERTPELNKALEKVTVSIEKYLLDRDMSFSHKKWCDILKNDSNLTYGQAQKIINMAFKYYYCCDNSPDEPKFYNCHMPLDKYTLKWVKEITGVLISGWSNIDNYDIYLSVQNEIKKHLQSNKQYSKYPLIAEFEIWQTQRNK